MRKTTIYLPDDLKAQVGSVARREGRTEAEVMREAIAAVVRGRCAPTPRVPLTKTGLGDPTIAERIDEVRR